MNLFFELENNRNFGIYCTDRIFVHALIVVDSMIVSYVLLGDYNLDPNLNLPFRVIVNLKLTSSSSSCERLMPFTRKKEDPRRMTKNNTVTQLCQNYYYYTVLRLRDWHSSDKTSYSTFMWDGTSSPLASGASGEMNQAWVHARIIEIKGFSQNFLCFCSRTPTQKNTKDNECQKHRPSSEVEPQ